LKFTTIGNGENFSRADNLVFRRALASVFKPVFAISLYGSYSFSLSAQFRRSILRADCKHANTRARKFTNYEFGAKVDDGGNLFNLTAAV